MLADILNKAEMGLNISSVASPLQTVASQKSFSSIPENGSSYEYDSKDSKRPAKLLQKTSESKSP